MSLLAALGLQPAKSKLSAGVGPGATSSPRGDDAVTTVPKTGTPTSTGTSPPPVVQPQAGSGAQPQGGTGTKPGTSPQQVAYDQERAAVVALRSALGAHKQAAHVTDKTGQADTALTNAASEAAKPDWPKAMAQLATARKACEDGKTFADGFADYRVKRAEANLVFTAAQTSGWTGINHHAVTLTNADTKAAAPTRNYGGAKTDCDGIISGLAPFFKKFYVDDIKPKIATLKTAAGNAFIKDEIAAIDTLMARQEAGIAAKEWRQVRLNAGLIADRMAAAEKMAARRHAFELERPKADEAVKKLAPFAAAVAAPLAALQKRIAAADAMASKAGMQFEDAKTEITNVVAACGTLQKLAESAATYTTERAGLASELSALRSKPGADQVKGELDVVRGLLDDAAKAAGDAGAPGVPLALAVDSAKHDIATARARIAQGRANFTTAKSLAESLGAAGAATAGLKGASTVSDLRKAADTLTKEFDTAGKAAHADLAKTEFENGRKELAEARKQIDAKGGQDAATKALKAAGQWLAAGRRRQIEHASFVDRQAALQKRLTALNADKALADKIRARIDALDKALADADKAEKVGQHGPAIESLNKAEIAAGAADAALVARIAFDKSADAADTELKKPENAGIKVAQAKELENARKLADKFDFDAANRSVAGVTHAIDAVVAEGMAKKSPPDPKLAAQAKKLFESGATKELDALIKTLPSTLDKKVFIDLAQARFPGVTFEAESDGHEQKSIQRMCELMKDIPDDVIGNPSLKKINRRVTKTDGSGASQDFPYYNAAGAEVVMNSRPKQWNKPDFEPGASGRLPDREEAYKPENNKPEDLFDFNFLHELAHGIDDAKGFMASKERDPEYGGWITIGGAVDQIVDAVVTTTGFGKSAEERKYIRDRILRNPAVAPTTFAGNKARFELFIAAAQTDNVWDSQALTDQATLGTRVYHEGYPNVWFSYLAAARKRGITSYQFRAPGEWFSELYAAWKVGKLKPNHPAVTKWLSKIKV